MSRQLANTLETLIQSLETTLGILQGEGSAELHTSLHDHNKLPDKELAAQAGRAVDLLHATEQLLSPGTLILADHFLGYVSSKCLVAAIVLNVPDALRNGSLTVAALAEACEARPDRLRQVLRILHNNGIFKYNESNDSYANNSTSELLLSDHWTQWRNWVDLYGNEFYLMACGIPMACRKDAVRMPAQIYFDTDDDMFTYFAAQGWVPRLHKTLGGGAKAQGPGILEDYPWEDLEGTKFLDVGGGSGGLVAEILRKRKTLRGGVLDKPEIIDLAKTNFHSADGLFADVGELVSESDLFAGDFLINIPSFEVYIMKWCLHDWDDSKALKIMTNIRNAITKGPKSRLIILESLLTDGQSGRLSRYGDIIMWMSANGEERNEKQWRNLAKQTGWKLNKIYPLRNAWPCAIEFVPDWNTTMDESVMEGAKEALNGDAQVSSVTNGFTHAAVPEKSTEQKATQVQSTMRFLEPWESLARGNPFIRSEPAPGYDYMNFTWEDVPVTIWDARPIKEKFNVDEHGFAFFTDAENPQSGLVDILRNNNKAEIEGLYYPCIERLMTELTGAERVIIFDHTLRKRDPGRSKLDNPTGKEQPATMVHCDQSANGALRRLRQNIGPDESVNTLLKSRVQMFNIWRPLVDRVVDWPLALMDYHSLSLDDVHSTDLWKGEYELRGQTMSFTHNPNQKWWYLSDHQVNETTVIKIWDSDKKTSAKFCAHAAFEHPDTPLDAPPRESIEVRCIVIHEPTDPAANA